jgi:dethiobiotin synthetase
LKGVFIAGTDTGVGKTFVARGLCLALRRRGVPVVGVKPFETGCAPDPLDGMALERAARSGLPLERRCFFRYRQPLAPAVAAESEGLKGTVGDAITGVRRVANGRFVVVEAAGGLEVPLDGRATNLSLARGLGLPVILVGRDALGTLNHTALSVRALRDEGIAMWGLVLSRGTGAADSSRAANLRWVKRMTGVRRAIVLPRSSLQVASERLFVDLSLGSLARLAGEALSPRKRN